MLLKFIKSSGFLLRTIFLLSTLLVAAPALSAPKTEEVKAAYIFNFLKFIRWPDENAYEAFRIGFIGDDEAYFQACMLLQSRSIRNKAIVVHRVEDLNDIRNYQVIITSKDQNPDLPNIARVLYGAESLLISDGAKEKQLTMINFSYPNPEYVGFEVNRYNMLYEKFEVSSDILLLGGTELDIANLLREMEQELASNQKQLREQNEKLSSVQSRVAQRERELAAQAEELERVQTTVEQTELELIQRNKKSEAQDLALLEQTKELENTRLSLNALRSELGKLEYSLTSSKERLVSSASLLEEKQKELSDKESSIGRLSTLIETNRALLLEQERRIEEQAESLRNQEQELAQQVNALEGQRTTIQAQSNYLLVALTAVVAIAIIALLILRTNRVRARVNKRLADANDKLEISNALLRDTQGQLVEAEKMASLGGLVAGVAHEINTPLGVSVTAVSHLDHAIQGFKKQYEGGSLRRSELESLLEDALESTSIVMRNLNRATDLVGNFKQVATDQMMEELRRFDLEEYLIEVCQSLMPQLKPHGHDIQIECKDITMNTYPGALAQVITNLVMNSMLHGFDGRRNGRIVISCVQEGDTLCLNYKDNGHGIEKDQIEKIFEPFYTTKRANGGTGLGMHISYNLVSQTLKGQISCIEAKEGAHFQMRIPLNV